MRIVSIKAFDGPNLHSLSGAVEMQLDLEDFAAVSTDRLEGFVDGLVSLLPGLVKHECSLRVEGGFLRRVEEGTYLAHVVEHVSLELQAILGIDVRFGKTRLVRGPGLYRVVFGCDDRFVGEWAGQAAVEVVGSLVKDGHAGARAAVAREIARGKRIYARRRLGPSTQAIVGAAAKRGIPWIRLNEGSLVQLGHGARSRRIQATLTDATSCLAADVASDKMLSKQLLAQAGVPVPPGVIARSEEEAVASAKEMGFPVVVKPLDGNQGKGVSLDLRTAAEVTTAFRVASGYGDAVIVEKYVPGRHYRLLVIAGKMVAAAERFPAHVVGDGVHSVEDLVNMANEDPNRGDYHEKPLTKIKIDAVALMVLAKQGKSPGDVPRPEEVVCLRENANLSTGGTSADCTERVHPRNAALAVRCAEVIGLDVAGIDIVAPDIADPLNERGAVIEVNAAPGLRMHSHPARGKGRPAGELIVDMLFPPGCSGRIPIVCVTGTNGKTTTTRMISHILSSQGLKVGMACTGGVYVGGEMVFAGDATGPKSCRMVLTDKRVEAAVLETARGGILREGVGFRECDVAVVTNVGSDHLGAEGIELLEDLLDLKGLLVELVRPEGFAVLNADDPLVSTLAERCPGQIAYFSMLGGSGLAKERCVALQGGEIRATPRLSSSSRGVDPGGPWVRILEASSIPAARGGRAAMNLANALAAAAACLCLGIEPGAIGRALSTFGSREEDNPGRLSFYDVAGVKLLLDYAHNVPALKAVLPVARAEVVDGGRLIGVVASPGDRRDEDIAGIGRTAAAFCDLVVIKEDADTRGRPRGEAAKLIWAGAAMEGKSAADMRIVLDERDAIRAALSLAAPGDVVAVFHEDYDLSTDAIEAFADRGRPPEKPVTHAANGGYFVYARED